MREEKKGNGRVLWITSLIVVLGMVLLGGYKVWELAMLEQMVAEFSPPPPAVNIVEPREVEWRPGRVVAGSVEAGTAAPLTTDVPGLVASVIFRSGQEVRKGDVLLELDASLETIRLQGLAANLALMEADYERSRRLHLSRAISDAEWEAVRAKRDGVLAEKKELERVLEKKRVRAPFDGAVGLRDIHPGRYLAEGDTVVELVSKAGKLIRFSVRVADLSHMELGTSVVFMAGSTEHTAKVVAVSPLVDENTRQVEIEARIDEGNGLPAGAFVKVRIPTGEKRRVLTVPVTAIKTKDGRTVVFRLVGESEETRVEAREVVAGPYVGDQRVIESGLEPGDRIVSIGNFKLQDSQRVLVSTSSQPEARQEPLPSKN